MWCKQCKTEKPPNQFLWNGRRGKFVVKFCNACASANMLRYHAMHMVGKKPEEFRDAGD